MRKITLLLILFFLSPLIAYTQEQLGRSFIEILFIDKNYDAAYSYFNENTQNAIPINLLKETEQKIEGQIGKFQKIIEVNDENQILYYYSEFEKMKLDIKIVFDENSKIAGFSMVPHKEIKKNENALGTDLSIKSNQIELKGTLLMAKENDKKNLVIFIHGTGPQDRDETIYDNKPFKDIAEGLYKNGISSYRFDKRTFTYQGIIDDKSTIDDEVTEDVLSIVDYFSSNPQFKEYKIILLGHSFGAFMLPRIANKTQNVDKIILMAGNARPLDKLIYEQCEYLYKLTTDEEAKKELIKTKEDVAKLRSKGFKLNPSQTDLPLGLSYYYWNSLFNYDPLKEVKKVKIPMLVLQGERDYQVTMKDFDLWKKTLKTNKKASLISYPKLNHLFIAGEKISEPGEYTIKGNVDLNVINDISNFLNQ